MFRIAINDRSTDYTGRQLDVQAAAMPRRVVHIESLPPGWLGKCHALLSGAKPAHDAHWIFFVDSDVMLVPNALRVGFIVAIAQLYVLTVLTVLWNLTPSWDA